MRRALAGLLSVAAVVVAAQAGIVSSAAATPATAAIICPLEPAMTVTCCGPPLAKASAVRAIPCCVKQPAAPGVQPVCCPVPLGTGTCPSPPPPTASLTIASTPNPSTAGKDVTISGTANGSVALWQELPGQRSFREMATSTPDAAGAYKFVRGPMKTNVKWYVVAGGARSKIVSQRVTAVVTITASPRPARAHRARLRFTGRVTPNHAGDKLLLQRLVRGGWRTVASTKINRASRYAFRAGIARRGRTRVRAVLPADSRNARSFSPVLNSIP